MEQFSLELVRRIIAIVKPKVIALTALAMKGDETRIRGAGCDGYIAKPLEYKNFLAVVSAHFDCRATEGA